MKKSDSARRSNLYPFGTPPEFPYDLLVRCPLVGGIFFLVDDFWGGGNFPVTILLPGYIQIFAIPVGLYVLLCCGHSRSLKHWAALFCGLAQLLLASYVLSCCVFH